MFFDEKTPFWEGFFGKNVYGGRIDFSCFLLKTTVFETLRISLRS
jgi:hypothetical protein